MNQEGKMLMAFLLNLFFSVFELFGGLITGSVAIASDAVHDLGDAASIGLSYFLERRSRRHADEIYTFGYARYSALGGFVTSLILGVGSLAVILGAVKRLFAPHEIDYGGMLVFALIGLLVNLLAAYLTHGGESINQRAVNLHMLEDVLGWAAVLVGAFVMRFTDFALLDPILSICVSLFVLYGACRNVKEVFSLFLERVPRGMSVSEVKELVGAIGAVQRVTHVHLWSMDVHRHCATMHVITDRPSKKLKDEIRAAMASYGVAHTTIEFEETEEAASDECPQRENGAHAHAHRRFYQHH